MAKLNFQHGKCLLNISTESSLIFFLHYTIQKICQNKSILLLRKDSQLITIDSKDMYNVTKDLYLK